MKKQNFNVSLKAFPKIKVEGNEFIAQSLPQKYKELPSNENCNYTKAFEEEEHGAMGPQKRATAFDGGSEKVPVQVP